jgi:uncharacterized membrane protein (UPF0127 family)
MKQGLLSSLGGWGGTLLILFACSILLPGVSRALETTTITVGKVSLVVEVADDRYERSVGLMYRTSLSPDRGMLFVFPDDVPRAFWMKNTTIPLSIAFADATGRIIAIMDMEPDDGRARYLSPGPARYALEVNRGWFEKNGIRVGDGLTVPGR